MHMGPNKTATGESQAVAQPFATALAEVALIDAETCAAPGMMSVSWWHEEVRSGRAPKPAVQRPRCTRWRLADVKAFWRDFATTGEANTSSGDAMKARLADASAKARKLRGVEVAA
jgi:hypothetical protein